MTPRVCEDYPESRSSDHNHRKMLPLRALGKLRSRSRHYNRGGTPHPPVKITQKAAFAKNYRRPRARLINSRLQIYRESGEIVSASFQSDSIPYNPLCSGRNMCAMKSNPSTTIQPLPSLYSRLISFTPKSFRVLSSSVASARIWGSLVAVAIIK